MADSDVLERNEELNKKVANFSSTYTRRKVVDSFLVVIVTLLISVVITILFTTYNLDKSIKKSSLNETQLICAHLIDEARYVVCDKVGLPELAKP